MSYSISVVDDDVACDAVADSLTGLSRGVSVGGVFFCLFTLQSRGRGRPAPAAPAHRI